MKALSREQVQLRITRPQALVNAVGQIRKPQVVGSNLTGGSKIYI